MGIEAAAIQRANLLRDGDVFHYGKVAERPRRAGLGRANASVQRRRNPAADGEFNRNSLVLKGLHADAGVVRHPIRQEPPQSGQSPGPRPPTAA